MLRSQGAIDVSVDGRKRAVPATLAPGTHEVAVRRRGRRLQVFTVEIDPDREKVQEVSLERSPQRTLAWALFIGAGVSGLSATGLGIGAAVSHSQASDLDDDRKRGVLTVGGLKDFNNLIDRRDALLTSTYIAGGAALALGIAGAAAYWFDLPDFPAAVEVAPRSATVTVGASF